MGRRTLRKDNPTNNPKNMEYQKSYLNAEQNGKLDNLLACFGSDVDEILDDTKDRVIRALSGMIDERLRAMKTATDRWTLSAMIHTAANYHETLLAYCSGADWFTGYVADAYHDTLDDLRELVHELREL